MYKFNFKSNFFLLKATESDKTKNIKVAFPVVKKLPELLKEIFQQ